MLYVKIQILIVNIQILSFEIRFNIFESLYNFFPYTIQHMINHELASSFLYDIIVPRNQGIKHIPLEEPIVLNIALVWKKDRYLHSGAKKVIECSKHFTFSHYHG